MNNKKKKIIILMILLVLLCTGVICFAIFKIKSQNYNLIERRQTLPTTVYLYIKGDTEETKNLELKTKIQKSGGVVSVKYYSASQIKEILSDKLENDFKLYLYGFLLRNPNISTPDVIEFEENVDEAKDIINYLNQNKTELGIIEITYHSPITLNDNK